MHTFYMQARNGFLERVIQASPDYAPTRYRGYACKAHAMTSH